MDNMDNIVVDIKHLGQYLWKVRLSRDIQLTNPAGKRGLGAIYDVASNFMLQGFADVSFLRGKGWDLI